MPLLFNWIRNLPDIQAEIIDSFASDDVFPVRFFSSIENFQYQFLTTDLSNSYAQNDCNPLKKLFLICC
jgi:hypothetical protein